MRIFLTGASGLVGSAFARASARRGHTVTGIVGNFSGDVPGLSFRRPFPNPPPSIKIPPAPKPSMSRCPPLSPD